MAPGGFEAVLRAVRLLRYIGPIRGQMAKMYANLMRMKALVAHRLPDNAAA
jgi:hypothetical protein